MKDELNGVAVGGDYVVSDKVSPFTADGGAGYGMVTSNAVDMDLV